MAPDDQYPVNATKTSFELLEVLTVDGPLGVTALASQTDVSKGTVYNHLSTLRMLGYVKKTGDTYDVTFRTLAMGERIRERTTLYRTAKPHLNNLTKTAGEYTGLYIEEEGRGIRIYHAVESDHWSPPMVDGERIELHATAAGKAILSLMPDDRIDTIIERWGLEAFTEETITDRETLFQQLRKIREDGVAFSRSERFDAINAVAAPIRVDEIVQYGAISVAGSAKMLKGRHFAEDVTGQVLSTAKRIEIEVQSS